MTTNVEQVLLDNPRVQKEHELYIRADKDARYGVVARAVAAARVGERDVAQPARRPGGAAEVSARARRGRAVSSTRRRSPSRWRWRLLTQLLFVARLLAAVAEARAGGHLERQRAAHRGRDHAGAQAREQEPDDAASPVAAEQAAAADGQAEPTRPCPPRRPRRRPQAIPTTHVPDASVAPVDRRGSASSTQPTAPRRRTPARWRPRPRRRAPSRAPANGTETDPLKARAADMYRAQLASWFANRFHIRGKIPFDKLKTLHASRGRDHHARPHGRRLLRHAAERRPHLRRRGAGDARTHPVAAAPSSPPRRPMYPDMLGQSLPVGFSCTIQRACE